MLLPAVRIYTQSERSYGMVVVADVKSYSNKKVKDVVKLDQVTLGGQVRL